MPRRKCTDCPLLAMEEAERQGHIKVLAYAARLRVEVQRVRSLLREQAQRQTAVAKSLEAALTEPSR